MINFITYSTWFLLYLNYYINCENFREGTFIYQDYEGVKVCRTLNEQTEIIGDTLITSFSIKWVSDCSYLLIPQKVIYKSKENVLPHDTIQVDIIEVLSDKSYRYKAITNGVETKYTMVKITK